MENEIDLKEVIQVLWRGKYIILAITAFFVLAAIFYVLFLCSPVYRYSSILDLAPYQVKNKEVIALLEQNRVVAEAVKGLAGNSDLPAESVELNVLSDSEYGLQIKVQHGDPEMCTAAVKQIGLAIIQSVSDYRFKQMSREKERCQELLVYLDEAAAEYLLSRDSSVAELLEEDPVYKRLLEEKAGYLIKLKLLGFDLNELSEKPSLDAEVWLNDQNSTPQIISVNKKLYIALAMLLGLMLSVFILFVRHYFTAQTTSGTRVK